MSTKRLSSFFTSSASVTIPSTQTNGSTTPVLNDQEGHPKVLKEFREQIKKGLPPISSIGTLRSLVDAIVHPNAIDDRELVLEHVLSFVSGLKDGFIAQEIRQTIIKLLYNDLSHPAATRVGNNYSSNSYAPRSADSYNNYAWRFADGSNNNVDLPDLGKAGTPYARSVQQAHPLPINQLPDAGLLFDTLLKREGFVEHPGGLSSLMFAFATLVIHSIFRTSYRDGNINETSSYVDLGPLYGNDQKTQDKVRARDGRGFLHPDVFAEDRILQLPPAVSVLLVLFNRNHNYIAAKLLEVNERGTYKYKHPELVSKDDPAASVELNKQEEDLFQTARLINCGWFGTIVFSDYFSTILGLVRQGSRWSLTPFEEIRNSDHSLFERGRGNVCSVEFNSLYRWHATTSRKDEELTNQLFQQIFHGKPVEEITEVDFKKAVIEAFSTLPADVTKWEFGGLKRQEDGRFKDEDLANVLQNATEEPAAAFRARGTPAIFRANEVMGIKRAREWGVCSLNDFRRFLGLKPFASFLEWNSDKKIASVAEKLYGDIEHLELYVGLQAEEAVPLMKGAGLCPGYTISRAILSDAIALTRGDRYFTHDFTPANLTSWGFSDCQRDTNGFGFGSTLGPLFLRTLPNDFTENSVYTFFPLMTPKSMATNLKNLGVLDQYVLARPTPTKKPVVIKDHATVATILKDVIGFIAPYKSRVDRLKVLDGRGFFPVVGEEQQAVSAVLNSPELVEQIGQSFYEWTRKFIDTNSYTLVGDKISGVDLVQQVLRVVPVYWVATDLAGIQLKTKDHPHGAYTPSELFDVLAGIFAFIFLDVEASKVTVLQEKVKKDIHDLLRRIKDGLGGTAGSRFSISGIVASLFSTARRESEHRDILKRLYELELSTDELANTILALMVISSVELTLATTNVVNLFLDDDNHIKNITAIAQATDKKTQLNLHVLEALRLDPPFPGVFRISSKDQTVNGRDFKNNDRIFLDIATSNVEEKLCPNPQAVDIARSPKECLFADGAYNYLGQSLTVKIVSEVVRAVFSFEGIRRAPGQSGLLPRFRDDSRLDISYGYLNKAQHVAEWPTSMSIQFNAVRK